MKRAVQALVGLVAPAVLTGCGASPTPVPTATAAAPPCGDESLAGAAVRFPNDAGATLSGYLGGHGNTGIVLANQLEYDACSWLPYAKQLAARGYRVLAFDFNSDDLAGRVSGSTDHGDVAATADLLRQRGVTKVVLLGASRGERPCSSRQRRSSRRWLG